MPTATAHREDAKRAKGREGFLCFFKPKNFASLRVLRVFAVCFCFFSAACVTTAQEGEEMRKDIAALRVELKKEIDTTVLERQKLADEQTAKSKALQDALDQLNRAARKSGADLAVDM